MAASKHITIIISILTAVAVVVCFLMIGFSDKLKEALGGTEVRMEYESKLFDTDEIITVEIEMDEEEWNRMLKNATSEEYYVCNVIINGTRVNNVAIRPKGNTSLSAIAMDPDSDRYSLKLEFDHFVEGQTLFGLDKLILNNNYADATNMKEAIIYDMYQYIGADASLYNYAKVSVNGEYWGVYLALEAVEQSFMLRNYGTQDGELYKPDSMDVGGTDKGGTDQGGPDQGGLVFSGLDMSQFEGQTPTDGQSEGGSFPGGQFPGGNMPGGQFPGGNMPGGDDSGSGFPGGQFPGGNMPGGQFPGGNMPDMGEFDTENMPDMSDFDMENMPDMGGFSAGGNGGANLNYTGDDLDNYSTIWENEVTKTGKSDHKKVVTALKNISEGNDLETYLDVDNILKYMAVHTFAVNMDSLTGSMAHNYYLYEYDGQLNLLPWDYNLSFGGMSMSANNGATDVVNDAIDTPFSATKFFDALLENEEYLERYHAYLQQLVDEYVNGGRLEEVYNRIRDQIDELVETDPTAFYSYEEYQNAAEILYEVIELRAESISGQLDGTIPSTDAGQRQDQSALIDASHLDITAMGQFDMGGSFSRDEKKEESDGEGTDSSENSSGSNAFGNIPNMGNMPDMSGFDPGNMPDMSGFDPGNMPDMGSFNPGGSSNTKVKTILSYGLCLLLMIAALIAVHFIRRRS